MKLSIITPVYNAAATLEKTIQSVLQQERQSELEYILMDGGSTDGSLDIIRRYQDQISLVISEQDRGVYDAMNRGVAQATGDVVGIINADDWYNPHAFRQIEATFAAAPETAIVYSPLDNYFDGRYLNTFKPGALENLVFKFTLNHPSCFVRRTVYEKLGGYDLSYAIAADYDFIFRAYTAGFLFRAIETPLASYSLNGMSGKPLAKITQMRESWRVASAYAQQTSAELVVARRKFYAGWMAKEILAFPLKFLVSPHLSRRIKQAIRQRLGGLPADQYGAW